MFSHYQILYGGLIEQKIFRIYLSFFAHLLRKVSLQRQNLCEIHTSIIEKNFVKTEKITDYPQQCDVSIDYYNLASNFF